MTPNDLPICESQAWCFGTCPWVPNPSRPLRSRLPGSEVSAAMSGWSLGELALQAGPAGLWVFLQSNRPNLGFGMAGIEMAMAGSATPTSLICPLKHSAGRSGLLTTMLRRLQTDSPAQALAFAIREHLRAGLSWREMLPVHIRGDAGMSQVQRRAFAQSNLGQQVRAAMQARTEKRWDQALSHFLQVRQLAVYLGRLDSLPQIERGIVQSAFSSGEFQVAARYERAILKRAEARADETAVARETHFLGVIEFRRNKLPAAVKLFRMSIEKLDAKGLSLEAAGAQANLARALDSSTRYHQSLRVYRQALGRYEKLQKVPGQLAMLRSMGSLYLKRLHMSATARSWFDRALQLARRQNLPIEEASICLDLARTEQAAGLYDDALRWVDRAEEIAQKANKQDIAAEAKLETAKVYWYLGEYQRAIDAQRAALKTAEQAGQRKLEIMARSLGGLIALNLGDLQAAEEDLQQALKLAQEVGLKAEQAAQLNNLGIVARERGDLPEALRRFNRAMRIDAELKSVVGRSYDLRHIGIVERLRGNVERAAEFLHEALQLSREVQDSFNEVKVRVALAQLELGRKQLDAAEQHARIAFEVANRLGLREVVWRALKALADVAWRKGDTARARERFGQAIAVIEDMRGGLRTEAFRSGFLDNKYTLYEEMIQLLLQLGEDEEAFAYSERARARGFLDLLANRQLTIGSLHDQGMLQRVRQSKRRMDRLAEDVRRTDGAGKSEAQAAYGQAEQQHRQLLAGMQAQRPELVDFVQVQPLDAAGVRAMLDPGVSLVSYYVLENSSVVWVIGKSGIRAFEIPAGRSELVQRVSQLRLRLKNFAPVETELRALYALLIGPIVNELRGTTTLGVVPHDVLHYLPFAALMSDDKVHLSDRFGLFSSPSASVLRLLLLRLNDRMGPAGGVLAVGDPELDSGEKRLPFAKREAVAIGYEHAESQVLLGRQALETDIKRRMGTSELVHLACHGVFDSNSPLFSALKLAPGKDDDGDLTALEVFSVPLTARLVTLSACQTGLGRLAKGDEIIGLNRAFLAAGASGVLSSLWRVSDVATALLMKRFHRNLRQFPPIEALRRAELIVRKYYPHPAYWSAFVLTGSWL